MDVQRKKGLLDVCVLAVLQRGPSYGYQIVRDVSACIAVSESTLYPILRRLEANRLVTTYTQEHRGRTRKYYQTTEAGRARIGTFLGEWEEVKQIYAFVKGTAAADGASFAAADTAPDAAAGKTPGAAAGKTPGAAADTAPGAAAGKPPGAAADTAPGAAANETSAAQMCMKGGPNGCEEEGMEEAHE